MSSIICGSCKETHASVTAVKECYGISLTANDDTHAVHARVPNGFYTIVFNEADDDRITLRVRDHWNPDNGQRGWRVVDYLSGPDNERDYTGFAFIQSSTHKWSIWKRFKDNGRLAHALEVLHRDPDETGMAYALKASRCRRCGRKLTVPASVNQGYGPECVNKITY